MNISIGTGKLFIKLNCKVKFLTGILRELGHNSFGHCQVTAAIGVYSFHDVSIVRDFAADILHGYFVNGFRLHAAQISVFIRMGIADSIAFRDTDLTNLILIEFRNLLCRGRSTVL